VPPATRLVGVDEQQGMLDNFAAACEAIGVAHGEVRGVWPDVSGQVDRADVVVCHHVAYNVAPIGPFVRALADHARRGVVVELPDRHPTSPFNPLWKRFWDLDRPTEPSAGLFVEVVRELGYEPVVEHFERPPRKPASMDRAAYVEFVRTRLCLRPDRDDEVERALGDQPLLSVQTVVTVSWTP